METGFIVQVYNWLFDYFFAGELPAVLVPISTELCSVMTLCVTAFAFAPIVLVLVALWKFFTSFSRF
jgi:hypothetical protein